MGEIYEDMIKAFQSMRDLPPVAMEVHVAPPDHRYMLDMVADPIYRSLAFSGLVVHMDVDLERSHFVAVMSDHTVEVRGLSGQKVALKILANNKALRIGTVKA